jgi:peptidoglycan/LPS O-acetylase OafA/YrhL
VGLFFAGALCCDMQKRIPLSVPTGIFALLLLVVSAPVGLFSYGLLLLLPYVILSLIIGSKQIRISSKIFSISYEMYLVGYPIQQTLIALSGNQMTMGQHLLVAIAIDLVVAWLLFRLTERMMSRK